MIQNNYQPYRAPVNYQQPINSYNNGYGFNQPSYGQGFGSPFGFGGGNFTALINLLSQLLQQLSGRGLESGAYPPVTGKPVPETPTRAFVFGLGAQRVGDHYIISSPNAPGAVSIPANEMLARFEEFKSLNLPNLFPFPERSILLTKPWGGSGGPSTFENFYNYLFSTEPKIPATQGKRMNIS